jgi:predicted ribosomally synthesized peptide with SipW-like signal peptide
MKKKVLAAALVAALIAIMVSGTLAYFTAEDQVDNTFTIGSAKIEIYENGEATPDAAKPLGKLTPVVNTTPSDDESYIDKVVDVKNTGANDAYIRTHIAIPAALFNYLQLDLTPAGWDFLGETVATVGGVVYKVYSFDHIAAVAPNGFTSELLQGVYLKSNVDLEEDASGNLVFILRDGNGNKTHSSGFVAHTKNADGTYTSAAVNILVASQAIQAQGFDNGATDALDSGFGANSNPWQ